MSLLLLKDEYAVDSTRTAMWNIYGGVEAEWQGMWNILSGVSAEWQGVWDILEYLEKEWQAVWDIGYYIEREFTAIWNIAKEFSGKVKHSFRLRKMTNKFYRNRRNG